MCGNLVDIVWKKKSLPYCSDFHSSRVFKTAPRERIFCPSMAGTSLAATIVTYNSRPFIAPCLNALLAQDAPAEEVVVVDNASTDGTRLELERFRNRVRIVFNEQNLGFAAAQNQAIALTRSDWVLVLNPDVVLMPDFTRRLLEAARIDSGVGSICGKLLRIGADLQPPARREIDSAGIYFTPNLRHFDRGWRQPDDGRFDRMEYVFGASGAAALYRRQMIADISLEDGFFDPDFFSYREDADVAWRAQLLGWRCLFTPWAIAYHVRRVAPEKRRSLPPQLNMHSVKNRFLMQIKNLTGGLYRKNWLAITARDLLVAGACLLYEPSSLPAFYYLARSFPRAWAKRRTIMRRRRVDDAALQAWFQSEPAALPVPEYALG